MMNQFYCSHRMLPSVPFFSFFNSILLRLCLIISVVFVVFAVSVNKFDIFLYFAVAVVIAETFSFVKTYDNAI